MTNDWQKHHQNGMNLPDTPLLESLYGATTIGQARDQLGAILELSGPAPLPVALRALADPDFAKKLIAVRKFPVWRDQLLQDPGNAAFDALEEQVSSEELNGRPVGTTLQLLKKGSQALLRWGASGFKLAEILRGPPPPRSGLWPPPPHLSPLPRGGRLGPRRPGRPPSWVWPPPGPPRGSRSGALGRGPPSPLRGGSHSA